MTRRGVILLAGAGAVFAGAGYLVVGRLRSRSSEECAACHRPVHEHSRTIAIVDGKRASFCSPMCALSEHEQSHKRVEVVELTDFLSGDATRPSEAWVVRNSDVNPCLEHHPMVGQDKRPIQMLYDRCSPSILAFGSAQAAANFGSQHGGQRMKFTELEEEFRR